MADAPSPASKRALSDGEAEYNAPCLIRKANPETLQLQSAADRLTQQMTQMHGEMNFRDEQFKKLALACAEMSAKQDNTTSTENDSVLDIANALTELKREQARMQSSASEASNASGEQKEEQRKAIAQVFQEMSPKQQDASNTANAHVRDLSKVLTEIKVEQIQLQNAMAGARKAAENQHSYMRVLGEAQSSQRREMSDIERPNSSCQAQVEAMKQLHLEELKRLQQEMITMASDDRRRSAPLRACKEEGEFGEK